MLRYVSPLPFPPKAKNHERRQHKQQFYVAICPPKGGFNDAAGFFQSYLALPVVMLFWLVGFAWKRQAWLRTRDIDVDLDRRELDWDAINEYRAQLAAMPTWKRIMHTVFI